jgi:membrane-anchored mycosin MYCP
VNPIAALTWDVPDKSNDLAAVRAVVAPPAPPAKDNTPRTVALIGTGALALVTLVAFGVHRRKDSIT